jgi:hypothetical protein
MVSLGGAESAAGGSGADFVTEGTNETEPGKALAEIVAGVAERRS